MATPTPNLSPTDKMAAARMYVIKQAPYFTSVLLSLVPRECYGLNTLGVTDSGVLLWDPDFVDRVTVPQLAAVLVHEIGHVLRDHAGRRKVLMADPGPWNIAGDAEINDDLKEGGWTLPGECVFPKTLGCEDGLTAEEYYAKLREQQEKQADDSSGQNKEGTDGDDDQGGGSDSASVEDGGKDDEGGDGEGASGDQGEGDGDAGDGGKGAVPGEQPPSGRGDGPSSGPQPEKPKGPCRGWCGSGAGHALPNEPTEKEEKGRSQSDLERVRNEVAAAIKEVAQKGRGTIPGGWVRWAEERLKPAKVPWRQKLSRIIRGAVAYKSGAVDLTYRKPSRRQAAVGYGVGSPILPAYHAPVPRVECWLDTSGSMGTDELNRGLSEISGVLKATGCDVVFGSCDARVHARGQVKRWQDLAKMVKGGGGTDFRPIFEEVDKPSRKFPRPDVLIFVTDGCGPAPVKPPKGMLVIWVLVGGYKQKPTSDEGEVGWGEFIEISEEEAA